MAKSGGFRPGAGRPKGAKSRSLEDRILSRDHVGRRANKRFPILTAAVAKKIISEAILCGQTPLEVMLFTMRWHFTDGRFDDAARVAKDAAPYMHPHLTSTKVEIRRPEDMTDDELAAHLAAAEAALENGGGLGEDTPPGTSQTRH
ncbi:MAG TPA: hypothetical protein VKS24_24920 [Bradyrhizobium sp.]|nr:hypothetical protein [Bradyrhizobium sp.]